MLQNIRCHYVSRDCALLPSEFLGLCDWETKCSLCLWESILCSFKWVKYFNNYLNTVFFNFSKVVTLQYSYSCCSDPQSINFLFLLHYFTFTIVMNYVKVWYEGCLLCDPQMGYKPQVKNHCFNVFKYFLLGYCFLSLFILKSFPDESLYRCCNNNNVMFIVLKFSMKFRSYAF